MTELKPCAFCGGKNITIIEHEPNIFENKYHALCVECLCRGASKADYAGAVEAWNRRVEE